MCYVQHLQRLAQFSEKQKEFLYINPFHSNFSANRILPSFICFGRERVWWITCNYPTVLKEKNRKKKEYSLRYLLAKVRTT
jgi:hypothetical protein